MTTISKSLLQSFLDSPLLVDDLPEAPTFPYSDLRFPETFMELNTNQKLGHLCEDAFALLVKASDKYKLVAQNLQIQTDIHTTVGELDFLIRDLTCGQLIHLELANKFYLAAETDEGLKLPGPDARDNYFKKLKHLRDRQLTLTQVHHDALPEEYRNVSIVSRQLIYGCLFDHIQTTQSASAEFINPHCRRGRWLTIEECADHFPQNTHFQIIPKPLWPVPLDILNNIPLETWTLTTTINRCVMLRIKGETVPYFVTPTSWPRTA